MMERKGKIFLAQALMVLLLLLGFPSTSRHHLQAAAVAVSKDLSKGSMASGIDDQMGASPALHEPGQVSAPRQERIVLEASRGRGRMDIAVDDYPGSGANDRHDPRRG